MLTAHYLITVFVSLSQNDNYGYVHLTPCQALLQVLYINLHSSLTHFQKDLFSSPIFQMKKVRHKVLSPRTSPQVAWFQAPGLDF
jgi:hypothetical protein